MMNSNSISTEASAGANSISHGKSKGSKAAKGLFSSLLAMLQKGSSKKGANLHGKPISHNQTTQTGNTQAADKNLQHILNQMGNSQTVDRNLQHTLAQNDKTQAADKNLQHILNQMGSSQTVDKKLQHTLAQNGKTQAADKNLQHILNQMGSSQTVDKKLQHILAQNGKTQAADKNLQHTLNQTSKKQATDKNLQHILNQGKHVDASDAIASLQETQATPIQLNSEKNNITVGHEQTQQKNRKVSQSPTQNISPELLDKALSKNDKSLSATKSKQTQPFATNLQTAQHNTTSEQHMGSQQGKQLEQQTISQQATAQHNNKIVSDAEQSTDGIKTSQAAIAAVQQRNGNQVQSTQTNHTFAATSNANAINMAAADNQTSSQQDLNSNQHDADMSLLDASKVEHKNAKGLDFQAQLAYKSQRTFTPADTMLEIVKSAKTGNTSLELQLEPAHLGKVQVSIQIDQAKHIQVMFTVDQAASKHALEQQMPQLKLAMAQQGLDLGGCSMQMNQQGGQQQSGNQQASNHGIAGTRLDASTTLSHSNDEQQTRIGVNLATQGHLSILA